MMREAQRVIEECSELISAICKAERFGWYNYHPYRPVLNIDQVEAELDDVFQACKKLKENLGE